MKILWHADGSGMVVGPRVHDSALKSLAYSDVGSLRLTVERTSGEAVSIELSGVTELNFAGFRSGAIISDISVWPVTNIPESAWDVPDSPWNVLFSGLLEPASRPVAASRIAQERPDAQIVCVLCSYGGALAAVCDAVDFYET
jgi:hypothetical protein